MSATYEITVAGRLDDAPVQVVQAGLLQAQAGHLLLERTGQRGEHGRGRAIDAERGMAAGPHQQMILRAALQMLQQRQAAVVHKAGALKRGRAHP